MKEWPISQEAEKEGPEILVNIFFQKKKLSVSSEDAENEMVSQEKTNEVCADLKSTGTPARDHFPPSPEVLTQNGSFWKWNGQSC